MARWLLATGQSGSAVRKLFTSPRASAADEAGLGGAQALEHLGLILAGHDEAEHVAIIGEARVEAVERGVGFADARAQGAGGEIGLAAGHSRRATPRSPTTSAAVSDGALAPKAGRGEEPLDDGGRTRFLAPVKAHGEPRVDGEHDDRADDHADAHESCRAGTGRAGC